MKKTNKFLALLVAAVMVVSVVALVACQTPVALSVPEVTINTDGVASWAAVENATEYIYKIDNGEEQTTTKLSVSLNDGESIVVKAVGDGVKYTDSAFSASKKYTAGGTVINPPDNPTDDKTKLATPVVTIDEDGIATWAEVQNASGYAYKVDDGDATPTVTRQVTLFDGESIAVKAVGDGVNYTDSDYSAKQTYTAPANEDVYDTYVSNADVIQDGENRYMVYTTNKTAGERDSVIAIKKATKQDGSFVYGEQVIAIEAGEGWDKYIGSASIVKGTFEMGGENYNYLIAYCASANTNESKMQIGLAVAKDPMSTWTKVGTAPVITFTHTESMAGCYAPSLVNYNQTSGIRLFYTYADQYGHFARFFDADLSDLDNIDGETNSMLPTNGNLTSGDDTPMFPNADWAYDATNQKFVVVKDVSPSAAIAPNFAYRFELTQIDEDDLYAAETLGHNGWESIQVWNSTQLNAGDFAYSACLVSDAYGHIIDMNNIEIVYNVCKSKADTSDFFYTQELKEVLYTNNEVSE